MSVRYQPRDAENMNMAQAIGMALKERYGEDAILPLSMGNTMWTRIYFKEGQESVGKALVNHVMDHKLVSKIHNRNLQNPIVVDLKVEDLLVRDLDKILDVIEKVV